MIRDDAVTRCSEIPAIEDRPISGEHWEKLISVDQIDEGEALLFAKVAEGSASLLTTGDQRSLIALGNAEGLDSFRDEIRGERHEIETARAGTIATASVYYIRTSNRRAKLMAYLEYLWSDDAPERKR